MIPFYRPCFDRAEVLAALRPGPGREPFESAVAARLGARYGIAFAYGRSGLYAAFKALGIEQADVVITAYTCVVMPQAIRASGNRPVFVDIDPTDFNMDLDALRAALTPQTRVVIATHLYGYSTDVDAVRNIVGDERVLIVEDCAQKLLADPDHATPLRGDLGMCSFGINKELCTVQGGVMVTNSPDLYQRLLDYRDSRMAYASVAIQLKRWVRFAANYVVFRKRPYGWLHRLGMVGDAHRLSEDSAFNPAKLLPDYATVFTGFQGRVGLAQLAKLDRAVAKRRALARLYDDALRDVPGVVLPPIRPDAVYSYYTVRVPRRDEIGVRAAMLAQGVAVDESYEYALPYLKPYRTFARGDYPHARETASQVVNLPIYPDLSPADARHVARSLRAVLTGRRE